MRKLNVVAAVSLAGVVPAYALVPYSVTALPVPTGASRLYVGGMASNGWVAGAAFIGTWDESSNPQGYYQPLVWHDGVMQLLPVPAGLSGKGIDVTSSGLVLGAISPLLSATHTVGVWRNGTFESLPVPGAPGEFHVEPSTISANGTVAGYAMSNTQTTDGAYFSAAVTMPAVWSNGQVQLLPGFPDRVAFASAANDSGRVIVYTSDYRTTQTYSFDNGIATLIPALAGDGVDHSIVGYGINDAGAIVGTSGAGDGNYHAFLYDGVTRDLGYVPDSFNTVARAINSSGLIVGDAVLHDYSERALLWDADWTMHDLNDLLPSDSGWILGRAAGIADDGTIGGIGTFQGREAIYLLTPVAAVPALPTPEPASAAMLLLPLFLRLRRRVRRRVTYSEGS